MAFFDCDTGRITFEDGLTLEGGMEVAGLEALAVGQEEMALGSHAAPGGRVAALLDVRAGRLHSVTLTVGEAAGRRLPDSARQREYLLGLLNLRDPCPDTMGSVCVTAPFGQLLLVTQPYTGAFSALIQYHQEEA